MLYEQIAYEVREQVLTITLNRPERLNAFTPRMADELIDACDRLDADDDVRAVVVTGAGRAFCAGADLADGGGHLLHAPTDAQAQARPGEAGRVALRLHECIKPIVAAINGPAVGAGITLTLPMDLRLISETARIGFVFTRRGIVPEACSTWFLPRLVGMAQATRWLYTGRLFDAREACQGGLGSGPYPPAELLPAAYEIARDIAAHAAPVAVAATRVLLRRMMEASTPMHAQVAESRALFELARSADALEGVRSFLDKRAAHFAGSASRELPRMFDDPQPTWAKPRRL